MDNQMKMDVQVGRKWYLNAPRKKALNWARVSPRLLYVSFDAGACTSDDATSSLRFVYRGVWESESPRGRDREVTKRFRVHFHVSADYARVKGIIAPGSK